MARIVDRLHPISQDLGGEAELEGILEILDPGSGAELQRAVYERRSSLADVFRYLLVTTATV
ncbi:MAG TPA: hypothetical protein VGB40_10920 [Rubrobacteraceae bacterium]